MRVYLGGVAIGVALVGCRVSNQTFAETDAGLDFVEVSSFPLTENDDLDVLFVLDDSPGTITVSGSITSGFPAFMSNLTTPLNRLPNLHIGVITGDMGVTGGDNVIGTAFGTGPGSCSGKGKNGALRIGNAQVTGAFLSDIGNTDLSRSKNYTSTLQIAFNAMASVGTDGCEFEQPLLAARRALDNNPANAGFLRTAAALAIVFITNEDDCSFKSSTFLSDSSLGPATSFRCTRNGITCDYAGATPAEMEVAGEKASCHSNEAGPLVQVSELVTFFKGLKSDPHLVAVRNIAAPVKKVATELRAATPSFPGGPALQHACGNGIDGDPAVRLDQVADAISPHRNLDACITGGLGYDVQMKALALQLSALTGRSCFDRDVPSTAECVVEVNGHVTAECGTVPCYTRIPPGSSGCPFGGVSLLPAGLPGWGTVRCRL